jgi:hypothetical protein
MFHLLQVLQLFHRLQLFHLLHSTLLPSHPFW